jgi:hypothetical protein
VVFVHGLFSNPRAWVQTINELRNSPAIASRYQFWVFLYPTGMPIPASAMRLRESWRGGTRSTRAMPTAARPDGPGQAQHGRRALKMMAQNTGPVL